MADPNDLGLLADAVVDPAGVLTPAALHGAVCGFAVLEQAAFPYESLLALLGADTGVDEAALERFVEAARSALVADDLEFAPLLPDDDRVELTDRLAALGDWCGNFLSAFGVALGDAAETGRLDADEFELPGELQEIIDDLAAIAEVAPDSVEDLEDEEAEAQLMELEEFVKVGVLLVLNVMSSDRADQDD
ncbi:MAG: UPF0149 family protein [Pseudomonadales bacterium]|nr:UPF0149 family protein [Pseudomonadales bacterium]